MVTSCDSYDWDGVTYDSTGQYINIYTAINGCDSTVTLDLTINYSSVDTIGVSACDFLIGMVLLISHQDYTNVYSDQNGCDSTVTLDLIIFYSDASSFSMIACDSYVWDGLPYTSTGVYANVYTNQNG